jgi:hypothetical protein
MMTMMINSQILKDILEYLKSIHHNNQFTVETETDGHLLFQDNSIYRRPGGSLLHTE